MDTITIINRAVVSLGIPTIAAVLIYIGRKMQVLDSLEKAIEKEIKPDLKDVRERFSAWEGKMTGYTQTLSPISLTPKGETLLQESGLKEFIDTNQDEFIAFCEQNLSMGTAYDIQKSIFDYFDNTLEFDPELEKKIKEYVYKDGTTMEIARRLGAIYFRDICLKQFNKDVAELDAKVHA